MFKRPYYQIVLLIAFLTMLIPCYLFIDKTICLETQEIRELYYIPLRILSIITSPGTQLPLWSLIFIYYLFIAKNQKLAQITYPIIASMIATNTVIRLIKVFVGRSRPDMLLIEGVYQLKFLSFERFFSSFPSGHASTLASILGVLAARRPKEALFWISLTLLLSLCRVYISAHYLSDVLFGNYLGFYFTWLFYFNGLDKRPPYLIYTEEHLSWKKLILSKT